MKRLTQKHYGASDYYMACSENCAEDMNCIDCPSFDSLVDRLGAYENTGLTPEEVPTAVEMAQIYSIIEENKRYRALNVTVDRIKELAEADKEGRVVVLPESPEVE
jgi:aspartate/tyrosine/aromatic aminotransferase